MIRNKALDTQVDEFLDTIDTMIKTGGGLSAYSRELLREAFESLIQTAQEVTIQRIAKDLISLTDESRQEALNKKTSQN